MDQHHANSDTTFQDSSRKRYVLSRCLFYQVASTIAHDIFSYILVKIDWKRSIQNSRCVDFYHVYAWKAGQPKERGQKIPIMNKNATNTELIIEPCVNYNFAVEFTEKDWLVFMKIYLLQTK